MAREQNQKKAVVANGKPAHAKQPARRRASMTDSATLEDQCHQRKIFVGGLSHKSTTQTLCEYFQHYGTIVDAVVLRWPDGRSRGFGYVTFADVAAASATLEVAHKIFGGEVDVKRAVPGTNKIFVGGLPQSVTGAEMRRHFEQFGIVSDAVVMMDPATNRSRGFGFVCFSPGQDGAAAVTTALERYDAHYIRGKWIEVKSAAPPRKLLADEQAEASLVAPFGARPVGKNTAAREHRAYTDETPPTISPAASSDFGALDDTRPAQFGTDAGVAAPGDRCLPPGLGAPPGLHLSSAPWPQAMPQQPLTNAAPLPSLLSTGYPGPSAGWGFGSGSGGALPSLLSTGHPSQFMGPQQSRHRKAGKADIVARTPEPMKIPIADDAAPKSVASADSEVFDASADLRKSLEQLLQVQMGAR